MTHELRTRTELQRLFAGPQPGALNMKEFINSVSLILDDEILFTKADLADAEVPDRIDAVLLLGEVTAGDGNAGIWVRRAVEPSSVDKIQDSAGAWWEKIEAIGSTFTYDVTKFGAKLDGVTDDTAAIIAAAAALEAAGSGTLWFPPGSKCLVSDGAHVGYTADGERAVLLFTSVGLDLEIKTNGCDFIFAGDTRSDYAHFLYCDELGPASRVKTDTIRLRYNNPPFVTGVVSAFTGGSYIDVEVDFVPTFADVQTARRYQDNMVEDTVFHYGGATWAAGNSFTDQGAGVWRLDISSGTVDTTNLAIGDEIILLHQVYSANGIFMNNCGDMQIDAEIRHTAGMGVRIIGGNKVDGHIRCLPDPSLRVRHSTNADGVHIGGCGYVSVDVNNEGTGDDGVAVYSYATTVTTRDSATQITCGRRFPYAAPRAGQRVQIVDANRALVQETWIESIDAISASSFQVTVADTLDAGVDNTHEFILATEMALIRGQTRYNRGRGVIAVARNIEIPYYTADHCSSLGYQVPHSSGLAFGIVKLANLNLTSIACNRRAVGNSSLAAIHGRAKLVNDSTDVPAAVHERVVIQAEVTDTNSGGILFVGVKDAVATNCRFSDLAQRVQSSLGFTGGLPIYADTCDKLTLNFNQNEGADKNVEVIDVTDVVWGLNPGLVPSSGTNPVTITSSPKAFLSALRLNGVDLSYEAGAFPIVPEFTFVTPGDLSVVYTIQESYYTFDGQFVTFWIRVAFTPTYTTSSGAARLFNLPKNPRVTANAAYGLVLAQAVGVDWDVADKQLGARLSSTFIQFPRFFDASATTAYAGTAHFVSGTACDLVVSGSYPV